MGIIEKELFHGAVLMKLIRSDQPVSLKMIEMNMDQSRSAYLINDDTFLYIKSSKNPQTGEREPDTLKWLYTFHPEHVNEINRLHSEKDVCLALVCGQPISRKDSSENGSLENPMEICFLRWDEVIQCLDLTVQEQQFITLKYKKGCKFRVWGSLNTKQKAFKVNQNALEQWKVPGS